LITLEMLQTADDVTFVWILGHSGIIHNNTVDALAKATAQHTAPDIQIG